jgi:hypothetical protein
MLHVQCKGPAAAPGCGAWAVIDCSCPPGEPARGPHLEACPLADIDSQVTCLPGYGCCQEDHHHGEAANACPGGHGECLTPAACATWHGGMGQPEDTPCPGGHCGMGVDGCTVCRPLTITILAPQPGERPATTPLSVAGA